MAKVTINKDLCKGCSLCIGVCPKKIISIDKTSLSKKGYQPAQVTEMDKCIGCAFCALICPDTVITVEK
ncbi:MAG: 4Fe-4S dicluster domain-containing protein [Firmicutes bacterium]|nr:4Fe-4S dicluster domain-containing protein [Bacillota bacterium]